MVLKSLHMICSQPRWTGRACALATCITAKGRMPGRGEDAALVGRLITTPMRKGGNLSNRLNCPAGLSRIHLACTCATSERNNCKHVQQKLSDLN